MYAFAARTCARWIPRLVRERTRREERSATLEQKFYELERLMQSLDDFGWRTKLDDDGPVRARWRRLRERLKKQ